MWSRGHQEWSKGCAQSLFFQRGRSFESLYQSWKEGGREKGRKGGREVGREGAYQLVGVSIGTPRPADPVSISTSTTWLPARKKEEE